MSIIKSIKQTDFTTIITTKSGKIRVYKFNTIEENNKFYYSHIQKFSTIATNNYFTNKQIVYFYTI